MLTTGCITLSTGIPLAILSERHRQIRPKRKPLGRVSIKAHSLSHERPARCKRRVHCGSRSGKRNGQKQDKAKFPFLADTRNPRPRFHSTDRFGAQKRREREPAVYAKIFPAACLFEGPPLRFMSVAELLRAEWSELRCVHEAVLERPMERPTRRGVVVCEVTLEQTRRSACQAHLRLSTDLGKKKSEKNSVLSALL